MSRTLLSRASVPVLLLPALLPLCRRLAEGGVDEPAGLVSDGAAGLLFFAFCLVSPRCLRLLLLAAWAVLLLAADELVQALHRLPVPQDVGYLVDPAFLRASTAGFHFSSPLFAVALLSACLLALGPRRRKGKVLPPAALILAFGLFSGQALLDLGHRQEPITARYHPLHWLLVAGVRSGEGTGGAGEMLPLPADFRRADLGGRRLLPPAQPRNVLLIALEGIPGYALAASARAMGEDDGLALLPLTAGVSGGAMVVPDFVVHNHQTIRGLYAMHCGDFSKLSFATPKAFELALAPERAGQCLAARLAAHGWRTHYLQGAGLEFMNKDQAMAAMGFAEVHGLEYFTGRTDTDFAWGTTDHEFFQGVRRYIKNLRHSAKPWFLSLLTVATHQPYGASEASLKQYGSRRRAALADLDRALADFLTWLDVQGLSEETLVIITCDESHGGAGAEWYSSWGLALVRAPEAKALPEAKAGTYGLVDVETSVLDYFGLPSPPGVLGRSFFRDYAGGRDMITSTAGKIRWQKKGGELLECAGDGSCLCYQGGRILGRRPPPETPGAGEAELLGSLAEKLDRSVLDAGARQVFEFGGKAVRKLPEKIRSDWADNLIGAQYLGFPQGTRVTVDIELTALAAPPEGFELRLSLRQFEKPVDDVAVPSLPRLQQGESTSASFSFTNSRAREAFSFHLLGEGRGAAVRIDTFRVTIDGADPS